MKLWPCSLNAPMLCSTAISNLFHVSAHMGPCFPWWLLLPRTCWIGHSLGECHGCDSGTPLWCWIHCPLAAVLCSFWVCWSERVLIPLSHLSHSLAGYRCQSYSELCGKGIALLFPSTHCCCWASHILLWLPILSMAPAFSLWIHIEKNLLLLF